VPYPWRNALASQEHYFQLGEPTDIPTRKDGSGLREAADKAPAATQTYQVFLVPMDFWMTPKDHWFNCSFDEPKGANKS